MKKYICTVCQWVYDPEIGDPEQGIEPGVAFENLPEDYVCPLCGVGKDEFEVEEWPANEPHDREIQQIAGVSLFVLPELFGWRVWLHCQASAFKFTIRLHVFLMDYTVCYLQGKKEYIDILCDIFLYEPYILC